MSSSAKSTDDVVLQYLVTNIDPKTGKVKNLKTALATLPIKAMISSIANPAMPADRLKSLKSILCQVVSESTPSFDPLMATLKKMIGVSGSESSATAAPKASVPKASVPKASSRETATAKASAPPRKDAPVLASMKTKSSGPQITKSGRVVKATPASERVQDELDDYRSSEDSDFDPTQLSEGNSSEEESEEDEEEEVRDRGVSKPKRVGLAAAKPRAAPKAQSSSESEEESEEESDEEEEEEEDSSTSEESSEEEEEEDDILEDNGPERFDYSEKESLAEYAKVEQQIQRQRAARNKALLASWARIEEASKLIDEDDIEAEFAFDKKVDGWKSLKKLMKNTYGLPSKHTRVIGLPGSSPVVLVDKDSEYAAVWLEPKDEGARLLMSSMVSLYADHGILFEADSEKSPALSSINLRKMIMEQFREKKGGKKVKDSK